jgi:hypothetical protein
MVIPLLVLLAVYLVVRDLIRGFGERKKRFKGCSSRYKVDLKLKM